MSYASVYMYCTKANQHGWIGYGYIVIHPEDGETKELMPAPCQFMTSHYLVYGDVKRLYNEKNPSKFEVIHIHT